MFWTQLHTNVCNLKRLTLYEINIKLKINGASVNICENNHKCFHLQWNVESTKISRFVKKMCVRSKIRLTTREIQIYKKYTIYKKHAKNTMLDQKVKKYMR